MAIVAFSFTMLPMMNDISQQRDLITAEFDVNNSTFSGDIELTKLLNDISTAAGEEMAYDEADSFNTNFSAGHSAL